MYSLKRFSAFNLFWLSLLSISCNNSKADETTSKEEKIAVFKAPAVTPLDKKEFQKYNTTFSNFFDTTLLRSGFNGGILIAKDGNIVYERYVGKKDLRKSDSMDANTPLHIASTSKTFTALAILQLVQQKKITLNDSLTKFFPSFPYHGITVQNLLSHRSGLPNYLYFMSNNKWGLDSNGKWTGKYASNKDVLDVLINEHPDAVGKPGSNFNYCNTNFLLLALIIEKVSGKDFPTYMQQHIFEPLQMNNTFVFTFKDSARATPSFTWNNVIWNYDFLDATYGDKNVYTTPQDLLKWDQALYTDFIVKQSLRDSAFTPYSFEKPGIHNYGLGWRMIVLPNGKKVIYHFGKWHGSNAAFARLIDEKATIIILGNKFNRGIYGAAHSCYDFFGDYLQGKQGLLDETESPESSSEKKVGKK